MSDDSWGSGGDEGDWGSDIDDGWDNVDGDDVPMEEDVGVRVLLENMYYEADTLSRREPKKALEMFLKVLALEKSSNDFENELFLSFKCLKHLVALELQLCKFQTMLCHYRELLSMANLVLPNELGESINSILNLVSGCTVDDGTAENLYDVTREYLCSKNSEFESRMYFDVSLRMAERALSKKDCIRAELLADELHAKCKLNGEDDFSKGSTLLSIYALRLRILSEQGNSGAMLSIFQRTRAIDPGFREAKNMAPIHECWGKTYGFDGDWDSAYTELWEAFLLYQQLGSCRAKQCLKYVVLAEMLSSKSINPFSSREAKVLEKEQEIAIFVELRIAFEMNDIRVFQSLVTRYSNSVLSDPFIAKNIDLLLHQTRARVLIMMLVPYTQIRLKFLGNYLGISLGELENLLAILLLENRISGNIDQVGGILMLDTSGKSNDKFTASNRWVSAIQRLTYFSKQDS